MGKKQNRVDSRAHNTQKQQNSHGQVSFARPPSLGLKERTRFQPDIPENSRCLKSAMGLADFDMRTCHVYPQQQTFAVQLEISGGARSRQSRRSLFSNTGEMSHARSYPVTLWSRGELYFGGLGVGPKIATLNA